MTIQAIKVMRQEKDGRGGLIFNISSLAGVCAFLGHMYYHVGKFAIEGQAESVAREMHPDRNSKPLPHFLVLSSSNIITKFPLVNFCIVEPAGVKTNFEGSSKRYMPPHEAYTAADMPARKLEALVKGALKTRAGIELITIAKSLWGVASREQKVPLHLTLGAMVVYLIKMELGARLQGLEDIKELSAVDKQAGCKVGSCL